MFWHGVNLYLSKGKQIVHHVTCLGKSSFLFSRFIRCRRRMYEATENYRPQAKLREGNVFTGVCMYTGESLVPCPFWGWVGIFGTRSLTRVGMSGGGYRHGHGTSGRG